MRRSRSAPGSVRASSAAPARAPDARTAVLAAGFALLVYAPARADSGTAAGFLTLGQLIFGNLVLGIGEGALLAAWFRLPTSRAIGWMIAGNYFSAWVGVIVETYLLYVHGWGIASGVSISELRRAIWTISLAGFFGTWLLTIVLEWPFCWGLFSGEPKRLRRSLAASVLAQTASYLCCMAPLYALEWRPQVLNDWHVERSPFFVKAQQARVFYLSPSDHALYSVRADGSKRRRLRPAPDLGDAVVLLLRPEPERGRWKLLAERLYGGSETVLLLRHLAGDPAFFAVQPPDGNRWIDPEEAPGARRVRVREKSHWTADARGVEGVDAGATDGRTARVFLETPFVYRSAECLTQIPDDQVVFQFGDEILVADLNTRQIASLGFGYGPAVLLPPAGAADAVRS